MSETVVKVLKITALCIVALLIVAALLYYVPWATPIDLTLNATKLDEAGNVLGTEEIHIKGHRLDYLFQEPCLAAEITPFTDEEHFQIIGSQINRGTIKTESFFDPDLMYVYTGGFRQNLEHETLFINFTEEMDCFSFHLVRSGDGNDVFYVASASGNYDTQGIIDYFNNICGGLVPGT